MAKTKIMIHFGFPKTGSSSLQFGFFLPLHNDGVVNLKTWRMYSETEHLEQRPSSRLFNRQDVLKTYFDFQKSKLNILSDESLTAPIRLRENNFENIENPMKFPELLKESIHRRFGDNVEIIPLIFIRKQSTLIYSQYVEEYNLKKYKGVDIVFDKSRAVDLRGYEIYKFADYIQELERVFGEGSVNVFMFEKWKRCYDDFLAFFTTHANLSKSQHPNLNKPYLESLLKKANFNAKKKNENGYYTKDGHDFIPLFSEEITENIMGHFYKNNKKLSSFLPLSDLVDFGYINNNATEVP